MKKITNIIKVIFVLGGIFVAIIVYNTQKEKNTEDKKKHIQQEIDEVNDTAVTFEANNGSIVTYEQKETAVIQDTVPSEQPKTKSTPENK